jgi:hypothetical protein
MGRSYGSNPLLNIMGNMAFSRNYMPEPENGQSMYDALIQKERTGHFMSLQRASFANNPLFSSLGVEGSPAAKLMGGLMGSPDSAAANLLSPAIGGNPMAASMHMYASMAGGATMGNFGRFSSITEGETMEAMQKAGENFYKTQNWEDSEGQTGIRTDIQKNVRTHLRSELDKGSQESLEYLQGLGFTGISKDKKGNLTANQSELSAQIDKYDLTGGESASEAIKKERVSKSASLGSDVTNMLNESDKDIQKALNSRLEEQLKAFRVASSDQIEQARGSNGLMDPQKVKELFSRYEEKGPAPETAEAAAAKKSMVATVNGAIQRLRTGEEPGQDPNRRTGRAIVEEAYSKLVQAKDNPAADPSAIEAADKEMRATLKKQKWSDRDVAALQERGKPKGQPPLLDTNLLRNALDKIETPKEKAQKVEASKELEKKLLENKVVTPQQLAQLRKSDGLLDADKAQTKLKEFEESRTPTASSNPEAERIKSNRYVKDRLAGNARRAVDELESANDDGDDKEKEKANKKLKDILTSKTPGVGYGKTIEQLREQKVLDKDDNVNVDKARKIINQSAKIDPLEAQLKTAEAAKEIGIRYKSINFENTRGFKFDELERASSKASELRMTGDRRGGSIADATGDFYKNAGGALSAARSIFGKKDASALVQDISSIVGSEGGDLSSAKGSEEVEMLLRKAKATARVAGVSISSMLQIIESAKDLAKNNPQLQYMNAGTSTDMTMKALGTAATMGKYMKPEEYRAAGANQGIAAENIKSSLAFAQSGMGQFQAATLALAKTPEQFEKLKAIYDKGITGADLDDKDKMQGIADILGTDINSVVRAGSNPLLAREGMRQKKISDAVTGTAAREGAVKGFYSGLRHLGGKDGETSQEALEAKYADFEGTFDEFAAQNIIKDLTPQGQALFSQYKPFLQQQFMRSKITKGLNPEQAKAKLAEFDAEVERQAEQDKKVSKKLDAAHAPIITQAVSALAEGKDFAGTAEAMVGILATTDTMSQKSKDIMEQARVSGGELARMGGEDKTDKQLVKEGNYAKELNKVLEARRTAAEDKLQNGTAAEKVEAKKTLDTLKQGGFTGEEYQQTGQYLKDVAGTLDTSKKARARLDELQNKKGLSAEEKEELGHLKRASGMGHLQDDEAYKRAQKGGIKDAAAAVLQGQVNTNVASAMGEIKANEEDKLAKNLEKQGTSPGGEESDRIAAALKGHGGDASATIAAYRESLKPENKGDKTNYFNQEGHEKEKAAIKKQVDETDESIRKAQAEAAATGGDGAGGAAGGPMAELAKIITLLTDGIKSGGNIATQLGRLADALK